MTQNWWIFEVTFGKSAFDNICMISISILFEMLPFGSRPSRPFNKDEKESLEMQNVN